MPSRDELSKSPGELIADGVLGGNEAAWDHIAEHMLKAAPKGFRMVAKRVPGAPGVVLDGVSVLTADNKTRALFGLGGSLAGGAVGGAMGGAASGGVGAPIGAAIGSAAGDELGTELYDRNRATIDPIVHDGIQAAAATARWMGRRRTDLMRQFGPLS